MEYRQDLKANRDISALGFGCMRLPKESLSEDLIVRALELGVNYFDTAWAYPGSEEQLGNIMSRRGLRQKMLIATKLAHVRIKSLKDADKMFETSLSRLQTDYVDYYLIHNVVSFSEWQRLVDLGIEQWIADRKSAGQIGSIGFSFHGSQAEFMPLLDAYSWDFCQIQYNYANENFQAGRAGLEAAALRGIPVIIMEPLLGGRLVNHLPKDAEKSFRAVDPQASNASWGLRWLWDQPGVTCVLSGMNEMSQLEDNAAVAASTQVNSLSDQERKAIDAARQVFERSFKVPCTGCNYCMPCPKGINIPAAFSAYNNSFLMGRFVGLQGHMMSAGVASGNPHFIADCVNCGKCAKACPQHIDIPARLRESRGRIEPPITVGPLRLFNKIMR